MLSDLIEIEEVYCGTWVSESFEYGDVKVYSLN